MNQQLFKQALETLNDADWQSLQEGHSLLIKDDTELFIGAPDSPNSLFKISDFSCDNAAELQSKVLDKSDELLANYYRSTPLTFVGFNRQVEALVEKHGVEDYCAVVRGVSKRTFFVEGGEVVSELEDSPRHRYGVFFEMDNPMSGEELKSAFHQWVDNSGAYFEYVGMNVCRYNC